MATPSILLIVHQPTSDPGQVGQWLTQNGYQLDMRCPAAGDPLPPHLHDHQAVVVFGGPMSANDDTELPFIRAELDWIPTVLEANRPFLGICLGAQLLARTLGAKVAPHPQEQVEVGYYPVYATTAGQSVLNPLSRVYHWHREGFEVPSSARLLATGDAFQNQAFQYGDHAYGLQFHPEITADLIDRWTTNAPEHLYHSGAKSRSQHFHDHQAHGPLVSQWLDQFLTRWLAPIHSFKV